MLLLKSNTHQHWAHTVSPRSVFQPPTGRTLVSIWSPSLAIFFSRSSRVGNGSLPVCLKPNLFGPKEVYKLDNSVARRFTQGFESPAALGDAQLPTRRERRNTNCYNLSESVFSRPSLMFGFFFTQAEKAKHLKNRHLYIFSHYCSKVQILWEKMKTATCSVSTLSLDGKFRGPQWWGCVLQTNENLLIFHLQSSTRWTHCSCYDSLADWQLTKLSVVLFFFFTIQIFVCLFLKFLNKSTPL